MTRTIKTYSMSERVSNPDFEIHDERSVTRIEQPHRHEYFQKFIRAKRPLDSKKNEALR